MEIPNHIFVDIVRSLNSQTIYKLLISNSTIHSGSILTSIERRYNMKSTSAAAAGNLSALKLLHKLGVRINLFTKCNAKIKGHFKVLKWLRYIDVPKVNSNINVI